MSNGPITVVSSVSSVNNATGTQILMDSTIPYTKLDTTNIVSFQTIQLLFNGEPAQPPTTGSMTSTTLIYQFPHSYSYIPTVWMIWQNDSPAFPASPGTGASATTYYPSGDDSVGTTVQYNNSTDNLNFNPGLAYTYYGFSGGAELATGADFYLTADATNVYFYVIKYCFTYQSGSSAVPLYLNGTTLNIRTYVFTEPANTSTY